MTDFEMEAFHRFVRIVASSSIALCGFFYVYIAGKNGSVSGRVRLAVFRCLASRFRRPDYTVLTAIAMITYGYSQVLVDACFGNHPTDMTRTIISTGLFLTVGSTFGVAMFRALFFSQPAIAN